MNTRQMHMCRIATLGEVDLLMCILGQRSGYPPSELTTMQLNHNIFSEQKMHSLLQWSIFSETGNYERDPSERV